MKKWFSLITSILLTSAVAFGQDDSLQFRSNPNEINIGFFNVLNLTSVPSLGIGYKRTFGNQAFRLGLRSSIHSSNEEFRNSTRKYSSWSVSPRIGYEWHIDFPRFQVL